MRRSSVAALSLLLIAGCAPPTRPVYIDLARALQETEVKAPAKPSPPSPPGPEASLSAQVPGKPSLIIKDRPGASSEQVRSRIKAAQDQALKDITERLRRFYGSEVARFELDQQKERTVAEIQAYENASARIRQRFEEYGDKRAPVFTQLSLIAGFPDPNPTSKLPDTELTPALKKRFDETVMLREQLRQIDREFSEDVEHILSSVGDLAAAQIAAMRIRIEQFKSELDRRAGLEAHEQVRDTAQELGLQLVEPKDVKLPATKPTSVSVLGGPAFRPAPPVPSAGILSARADRERLLRHERDIWLGLNRYRLGGKGDKDVTSEFLKWRDKFEVGP